MDFIVLSTLALINFCITRRDFIPDDIKTYYCQMRALFIGGIYMGN